MKLDLDLKLGTQLKQSRYLERNDTELLISMVQLAIVEVSDTLDRDRSTHPEDYSLDEWSNQVLSREVNRLQKVKRKLEGILEVCE